MSWISDNYEKTLVGGAVVVCLALGYVGWSGLQDVQTDFADGPLGSGSNATAVSNSDLIPKAEQSLGLKRDWSQARNQKDRPVDLFTGIPLFIKSNAPEKPIDLLEDPPVHPPISNTWWLEHRLDPGFENSPTQDPDDDGFTNREEFDAKTDPQNSHSYPHLIQKLVYVKDESLVWELRPSHNQGGAFPFNYRDSKANENRIPAAEPVKEGELFFRKGAQVNRFKLLGHKVRKELNKNMGIEMEICWVQIEDQRPNKKGRIYEFPAPLGEAQAVNFRQSDRTAVFMLQAGSQKGNEFKVEENSAFALPPDAKQKDYFLKSVTPDKVVIEYKPVGEAQAIVEIKKGSLPSK